MSIYGHILESKSTQITKESAIEVIKKIGNEIEKIYNSECKKLGIHEEKGSISTRKEDDYEKYENGAVIIEYYFSTYSDPDEDWEHSFLYYDSGNSKLPKDKVDKIIVGYKNLMKKIYTKIDQLITVYKKQGYNIEYYNDDYRGDQIVINIEVEDDESKDGLNIIKKNILKIFNSGMKKFKSYSPKNGGMSYYLKSSNRYVSSIAGAKFDKKYIDDNKIEFTKVVKSILEYINKLYKENSDTFDNNNLQILIMTGDYNEDLNVYLFIYEDEKSYNKKMYNSIKLPNYCLNAILYEKVSTKIEPYKNQFFKLLDKKIKEKYKINNNSINTYTKISTKSDKNYFFISYSFFEQSYYKDKKPVSILDTLRKLHSKEDVREFKNIIKECIDEITSKNKNLKITQEWRHNGNIKFYFAFTINFGLSYSKDDLNI